MLALDLFLFKVQFQLDFRLHSLCMLVWKQIASEFEGMNSIIPITSPYLLYFLRQEFGID